jgi:hypothetical protein
VPPQQKGFFYHIDPPVDNSYSLVGIAIKRPGEMQTESTPEAKRPRLQTKTESPQAVPQALGTTQPTAPASNPVQLPPSRSSQFPSTVQPPPRLTQQTVMEGLRKMEERIQVLELALATAQSERNAQEEENILQELTKNKENHAKFKQFYSNYLAKYMIARQQALAHSHSHSHSQSHLTPNLPQNQGGFWLYYLRNYHFLTPTKVSQLHRLVLTVPTITCPLEEYLLTKCKCILDP